MMPTKIPTESVVVEFDFSGEMDTIASASVTSAVASGGSDANPSGLLYGAPQIEGDRVKQRIVGGLSGVTYRLTCTATQGLDVIVRTDLLPVKTPS